MNQHMFGNRYILNPVRYAPWILEESSFAHIWSNKLVTVVDLYLNFNQNKYKEDPEVNSLHVLQPDLRKANDHFSNP